MLHYLRAGSRIAIMQSHTHTMQQTHTHKAVTRRVKAKKLLSRLSQSDYNIFFSPQPKQTKKSLTINFHGSLLLQQLLKFKNCGSVSAGFLALTPDDLVAMACDSAGSFLLEAFMASGASDKKKDKLIEKLKVSLAIIY